MTDGKHRDSAGPVLSNRSYDILKFVVSVFLPGVAAFYLGLDLLWNLPYEVQISGTITLVSTLLGLFLRQSSKNYAEQPVEYDGNLTVTEVNGEAPEMVLTLNSEHAINEIPQKEQVTFKVHVR